MEERKNQQEQYGHKPVLLEQCLQALAIRPDGIYLDGTLGRGGHSLEIVKQLTTGRLIALDRDQQAIAEAGERLSPWKDRITLVHGNFCDLEEILRSLQVDKLDGALFDLGVSSPQLDEPCRGFSYQHDAPLDMRMDSTAALDARQVVNEYPFEALCRILTEYGEERYATRIAKAIVRQREMQPIESTLQLVDVIKKAMPAAALREKQHPAKRTFQAIRIEVNGELTALEPMLRGAADHLREGGRLAVISFHSLEDRIVKKTMQELATGCTCPPEFPVCVCGKKPKLQILSRKPIVPSQEELNDNPRARSARLRVAQRCGES